MAYPYRVVLTAEQHARLLALVGAGIAPARLLTRGRGQTIGRQAGNPPHPETRQLAQYGRD